VLVRRKHPEKWRINSWFRLHKNVPAHRSVLVKGFIAKNYVTTLEHPQSPDMAQAEFNLFPRLKSSLKGRRCCDAIDIIKNATEELKRISQNFLQDVSKTFTVVCRSVCLSMGTTLKKMQLECSVLCFSEISDSGNILKLPVSTALLLNK
jgi:hypothetical protein